MSCLWLPAMRASGILPPDCQELAGQVGDETNLLPLICDLWNEFARARERPGSATRELLRRLDSHVRRGASLRFSEDCWAFRSWLQPRLMWMDAPWTGGRAGMVGILSSRLQPASAYRRAWLQAIRHVVCRVRAEAGQLVCVPGTTGFPLVQRALVLFDTSGIRVTAPSARTSLATWWKQLYRRGLPAAANFSLSPPLERMDRIAGLPIADRIVTGMVAQTIAISVRRNGNIHRLLRHGLENGLFVAPPKVVVDQRLTPPDVFRELTQHGAVGLYLCPDRAPRHSAVAVRSDRMANRIACTIRRAQPVQPWPYLTHCTRAPRGAFYGESKDAFADELLLDGSVARRSPLHTLQRIVAQRRIMASADAIRGNTAVVCLSEVPLWSLPRLTCYRAHRSRWDFLPYGICIRKDAIRGLVHPVRYGDESLWQSLSDDERPYFQLAETSHQDQSKRIVWTHEREWRHRGDMELHRLPRAAIFAFVPGYAEALQLARTCPWDIVVVGRAGQSIRSSGSVPAS